MTAETAQAATIECPQCGGDNALPSGERLLDCGFCDAALFVDRSLVVGHYRLPRLLSAEQARAALKRWMAGNETVKDLDRKCSIETVEPITFPMWMFRAHGEGGETAYVEPAAPTPIPQLADLRIPAGELEPYRPESAALERLPATIPLETARGWLKQRGVTEVTESSLVELPLWRYRYLFGGESYQAVVEASTGGVMAAVFPEKAESPYYLTAAIGLILFVLLGLAIQNPFYKLIAYAITALPLAVIAYLVTRNI